jgi:ATP-dependent DNA helicase RecG
VIGGLQAMAERWANDARSEGLPPRQIATLTELMSAYGAAAQGDRADIAAAIRRAATADFPTLESSAEDSPTGDFAAGEVETPPAKIQSDVLSPDALPPLTIPEGNFGEIAADAPVEPPARPVNVASPRAGSGYGLQLGG